MKYVKRTAACSIGVIIATLLSLNTGIRTNQAGLELIGNAESCRREPYKCPAGVLTDGVGNTHGVVAGTVKNDKQIALDWAKNIKSAEDCINKNFRGADMSDNAFSAMTSAAFNMGCRGLMTYYSQAQGKRVPTSIWRYAQKADWPNMCSHLPDFVRSGGVKLPGLVKRRDAEKELCLKP